MQTVDEKPETIHLYVVREKEPTPSVLPIVLSALSLIVLLVFCVLIPYQQPVTRAVIRVPAVLLPMRTFTRNRRYYSDRRKSLSSHNCARHPDDHERVNHRTEHTGWIYYPECRD